MAVFKILRDELYETWWRDYFEVEAETLEEAAMVHGLDADVLVEKINTFLNA